MKYNRHHMLIMLLNYLMLSSSMYWSGVKCNSLKEPFRFNKSFENKDSLTSCIHSICVHFLFKDMFSHLSFFIRTTNSLVFQLDLRLIGNPLDWIILLQKDDFTLRLEKMYMDQENCYQIKHSNIIIIQDLVDVSKKFIHECSSFNFYFKFAFELETIDEWKGLDDYEHEKTLGRVNCFAFTDYVLKEIGGYDRRNEIFKEVRVRGEQLMKESKQREEKN